MHREVAERTNGILACEAIREECDLQPVQEVVDAQGGREVLRDAPRASRQVGLLRVLISWHPLDKPCSILSPIRLLLACLGLIQGLRWAARCIHWCMVTPPSWTAALVKLRECMVEAQRAVMEATRTECIAHVGHWGPAINSVALDL
jgi:hypothetical protein